jgi:hypothetical protein
METHIRWAGRVAVGDAVRLVFFLLCCSGPLGEVTGEAQERESLTGERAAQALKEAAQAHAQQYNLHYGPVGFQIGSGLSFGYTDNAFYSQTNRLDDFIINPEVNLGAFMQVSDLNTLRLSLGVGYEYYLKNTVLNANAPMVNPDSELVFNLFVSNFHIRMHENFTYQETLFVNTSPSGQDLLFNFNDVGTFSRWDNLVGFDVDWDLNKFILSAGYSHENFTSTTASFDYLSRASEWFTNRAAFTLGDHATIGIESLASLNNYRMQTVMNDNWRAKIGPFGQVTLPESISLRAGAGYDTAQYDAAGAGSDYETYYAYGQISQETRLFTHALSVARALAMGDNANNLESTYVGYSISSPVFEHVDLGANASVHFAREFGGAFAENYTYYLIGLRVGYQFHKYWQANLGYEFLLKNSDLPDRSYYRDRVTLGVTFTF